MQSVVVPDVVNEFDGVLGADPPGPTATTLASYVTPLGGHDVTMAVRLIVMTPDASGVGFPKLYDASAVVVPTS